MSVNGVKYIKVKGLARPRASFESKYLTLSLWLYKESEAPELFPFSKWDFTYVHIQLRMNVNNETH